MIGDRDAVFRPSSEWCCYSNARKRELLKRPKLWCDPFHNLTSIQAILTRVDGIHQAKQHLSGGIRLVRAKQDMVECSRTQ